MKAPARTALGCATIPLACALVSTAAFLLQGGFGGGHGKLDWLVVFPQMPTALLTSAAPFAFPPFDSDLILLVLMPAAINVAVAAAVGFLIGRVRGLSNDA
jgi:hypothetical protein